MTTNLFLCKNILEFRIVFSNQSELASFTSSSLFFAVMRAVNYFTVDPLWIQERLSWHSSQHRLYLEVIAD